MSNEVQEAPVWISKMVDVSDNSTVVYAGPCVLRGVAVATALSAHACPIKDDTTLVAAVPASAGIGTWVECGDQRILTNLTVDPDDSGTGMINVVYKPNHDGLVGSGAGLP